MEMVERVGLAICRKACEQSNDLDDPCDAACGDCAGQARAAIEAMREPTEEMLTAGGYKFESCTSDPGERCHTGIHVWHGMIDAALSGRQSDDPS